MDVDEFVSARLSETAEPVGTHPTSALIESIRGLVEEYRIRRRAYLAIASTDAPAAQKLELHSAFSAFDHALRIVAAADRAHPDFQPEWDPDS